ncbi:hypothetical protein ACIP5Y_38055 [Nocardia sp. NPDC088792]|uniref:hypothetical protein n=1 Tax=Nocardia sp. NPDC088792 TaxID=3364332 RepID=UPI00380B73F3
MDEAGRRVERGPRWRIGVFALALTFVFSTAWTVGWISSGRQVDSSVTVPGHRQPGMPGMDMGGH